VDNVLKRMTLEGEIKAALKLAAWKWRKHRKLMSRSYFNGIKRTQCALIASGPASNS
jgi:hypothetical protein